ncbi:MAG: glycogen/starch/alpha-glucan phosphorylase, partial [Gammaproteobacteria bacterium]|nr:glycogen/starch/alpha-glucan phosphorylase [Gammaproteobacteria bacterium]
FLMGRALNNAVLNLDMQDQLREALQEFSVSLEDLANEERDAGLGNGGLGRLAACFLDSCATLGLPVTGYGILYDYGMFRQRIKGGHQVEQPDHWLQYGNPWLFEAPQDTRLVKFFGRTTVDIDTQGKRHVRWIDTRDVLAIPYDMPIPGFRNEVVNTLRLWKSTATEEFNLDEFNAGSYTEAVEAKNAAEQISMVLYPNDASENGKVLRLRQQYFLTSASLQDVLSRWVTRNGFDFDQFSEKNCFQLNDTHPAIAIAELMRLLVDDYALSWSRSWEITTATMAYTNHTLLPEALERWPVDLFEEMLPRLLEIIHEINARFLHDVANRWPGDSERLKTLSIIDESGRAQIRMAHLAVVGSFSVNGVAALHTELLKRGLFKHFYEMWPEKFNNKTNGVTPRRWLAFCNPELAELIEQAIDGCWRSDLTELQRLKPFADDRQFQERWMAVKRNNKENLARLIKGRCSVEFESSMLFDIQVKRIHEYKRQLLNILHVIHLYDRILKDDIEDFTPRCVLLGGKAAPGYEMAKLTIKLANNVASVINAEPKAEKLLRMAFLPDYNVTAMEVICAAADLSEQISTAGKEASGTGNMKFMMNGALTIGTLDGANIEIRQAVGEENFFLFGLDAEEVETLKKNYRPNDIIAADEDFSTVLAMLETGLFDQGEAGIFDSICHAIRDPHDQWMTAADFRAFVNAQIQVGKEFKDQTNWARKSILNTACSGYFSSDRTIKEYANEIWKLGNL